MVETSFNLFDAVVLGVVFLSTLLAFFRGFVREFLSLGGWIGAMAITIIYTPALADAIKDDVDKGQAAAMLVASVSLFFAAKIIFSIINMILMKYLRPGKDVGLVDNFLGLIFGFLRAALLLSLGYYVYGFVATEPATMDCAVHDQALRGARRKIIRADA
jgi:membrane protein required for colicin V production